MIFGMLHRQNITTTTCTLFVLLPLLANFYSRNLAEYFFDLLILFALMACTFKWGTFRWNNLFLKTGFDLLWPIWLLIIVTGYLYNKTFGEVQIRHLLEFLWIPGLYIYARCLKESRFPQSLLLMSAIFISFLGSCLIAIFFVLPPESSTTWGLPNRILGTFTNTNFLAHSYNLVAVMLLGLLISHLQARRSFTKEVLWLSVATSVLVACLFLTFTRSIWISLALTIPFMFFFWNKKVAGICLVTIATLSFSTYKFNVGNISFKIDQTLAGEEYSASLRKNLWKANLYFFKSSPILGVGYYNNTRNVAKAFEDLKLIDNINETHAHSEIISFLAGTGILGAICYVAAFIFFSLLAYQTVRKIPFSNPIERGLLIGAIGLNLMFLIAGSVENNFEIHVARNWLVVTWAVTLYLAHKKNMTLRFSSTSRTH